MLACFYFKTIVYICTRLLVIVSDFVLSPKWYKNNNAGVVELVDTLDLGSSAARCGSSSLPARTAKKSRL